MITMDHAWIGTVDHRISTAIVYFVLLILLGNSRPRKQFALRTACSLAFMCLTSWLIRSYTDVILQGSPLRGIGYSLQLLALFTLFLLSYNACYRATSSEIVYNGMLALTIYKIAWNLFKTGSSILQVWKMNAPWSLYSITGSLVSYLVYFLVCILCVSIYQYIVRELPYHTPPRLMIILAFVFVTCQSILEFCGQVFTSSAPALFLYYFCALLYTIINFAALIMIALLEHVQLENRSMHDFINNKMHYYEMSHDGIVSLQTECHDLKHQIAAIRSQAGKESFEKHLSELEDSINEYSTVIDCGNDTINVVLTEKNILCMSCQVKFSYMIDGTLFAFLSDKEIYSLFGNALDNALEAASKVADPNNRMISLKSNRRGNMVVLQIENTFEGTLSMANGHLQSTKAESGHGFGVRSIERIAADHNGSMSVRSEGGIFKLSIILCP